MIEVSSYKNSYSRVKWVNGRIQIYKHTRAQFDVQNLIDKLSFDNNNLRELQMRVDKKYVFGVKFTSNEMVLRAKRRSSERQQIRCRADKFILRATFF